MTMIGVSGQMLFQSAFDKVTDKSIVVFLTHSYFVLHHLLLLIVSLTLIVSILLHDIA